MSKQNQKIINELYNPNHFKEVITKLNNLNSILNKSENRINISRRHVALIEELKDLDVNWRRFLSNRQKLLDVDFKSHHFIESKKQRPRKLIILENELAAALKVDIKNLFIYSDMVFSKFVFLFEAICGLDRDTKKDSATKFLKSIRKKENSSSAEYLLYSYIGDKLEKIEILIGFYRDYFITHQIYYYQQGLNRAVFLPDIRIDMSGDLNKFNLDKFLEIRKELKDILPEKDKFGRPLNLKSDPRPKVEVLFDNLHLIKDENIYNKAVTMIRQIGIETPNIYKTMLFLKQTLNDYNQFLIWYLETMVLKISEKPLTKLIH